MKRNKKTIKTVCRLILAAIIIAPILTAIAFSIAVVSADDYVAFDKEKISAACQTAQIFDNDENLIKDADNYARLNDLPKYVSDAFVSTEDKRFYSHNGVDFKRVASAAIKNVLSGSLKEGASTITQQLVKNLFLSNKKTFKRKVNEVFLALRTEKEFSKNKILEAYLNTVYFGQGAYGISSAAKKYFNTDADKLTLKQAAGLAGILKAPNTYSPLVNLKKFEMRQSMVLNLMLKNGFITESQFNAAEKEVNFLKTNRFNPILQDYAAQAYATAAKIIGISVEKLKSQNYKIYTYLDIKTQKILADALSRNAPLQNAYTPIYCCGLVRENASGKITAVCGYSDVLTIDKKINCGSTIKPIGIYAPAIETNKITIATPVHDVKTNFAASFCPSNSNGKYYGWTTVKNSIVNSLNVPAVKTLNVLGLKNSVKYLKKNGFAIDDTQDLTLALGNIKGGVHAKTLLDAYSTLANDGYYIESSLIKKIVYNDKIVYNNKTLSQKTKVFSDATSFIVTDALVDTTKIGTAKVLKNIDFDVAGKTGTVSLNGKITDVLFCGYTTSHTVLFWYGQGAIGNYLPNTSTGGKEPTAAAKMFFENFYAKNKPDDFKKPQSVVEVQIEKTPLLTEQKIIIASNAKKVRQVFKEYFTADNVKLADNYCASKSD